MIRNQTPQAKAERLAEMQKFVEAVKRGEMGEDSLVAKLTRTSRAEIRLDQFITQDPVMGALKNKVNTIRHGTTNHYAVLITGPSGTGKELIAHALNKEHAPFISRNCAGIPKELISSIFFGHLKGTFTGADSDRKGVLSAAEDGVVFLDEIADLPMELQATLLRALQERVITRLGSTEEIPIHCRFVAATKFDLREMVSKGSFREDLFARLFDFELRTTSLEERPLDIPLIARDGIGKDGIVMNWDKEIPASALSDIYRYNVRGIQKYVMNAKLGF
jgi:transcriptional regulator with PAS, ATPase and Fis domain